MIFIVNDLISIGAGDGIDCLLDGIQGELWATSYNSSKCRLSKLEGF